MLIPILGGICFGIANLNFGTFAAPILGLAGVVSVIFMLRKEFSYAKFYLLGFITWGICVLWVPASIQRFSSWSTPFSLFCGILLIAVQSLEYLLLPFLYRTRLLKTDYIWLPFVWYLWEILTPEFFPWGVGNYFVDLPILRMLIPIVGVSGLSGIVTFLCQQKIPLKVYTASLITIIILGATNENLKDKGKSVRVGLIQPNLTELKSWNNIAGLNSMRLLTGELLTTGTVKPELIVWPESAIAKTYYLKDETIVTGSEHDPFPGIDVPIVFGAQTKLTQELVQEGNQTVVREGYGAGAIVLLPGGKILGNYIKQNLFPFSEGFPILRTLVSPHLLNPNTFDTVVTATSSVYEITGKNSFKIGLGICYDDLFMTPEHNKSDLLVFILNDLWFRGMPAIEQHFQLSRARALESGRPYVRVGNNGVSAVVNFKGEILWRGEIDQRVFKNIDLPLSKPILSLYMTLYPIENIGKYVLLAIIIMIAVLKPHDLDHIELK